MLRPNLLHSINNKLSYLSEKKITFGFDGFSDTILKVIRSKDDQHTIRYFDTIHEFGEYILSKDEKNFSLELEETVTKIGGNMPIMANALAQFGPKQSCIGAMGFPVIDPIFSQMPSNCDLYSFANPGMTKAMEFNGRKIMLAEIGKLNKIEWESIKEILGLDTIIKLFTEADLISILNWSELDNSTEIWKGLLADILPRKVLSTRKKPIGFFDLADCSKRTETNIREAMDLLKSFSKYWDVVLSLNLNEAIIVNGVLSPNDGHLGEIEAIGSSLYQELSINTVIIHYSKEALAWDSNGLHKTESFYVPNPQLSTGAGDNFNAGYCAGRLMQLDTEPALLIGHATSSYYMENGKSPAMSELFEFLSEKLSLPVPSIL